MRSVFGQLAGHSWVTLLVVLVVVFGIAGVVGVQAGWLQVAAALYAVLTVAIILFVIEQ